MDSVITVSEMKITIYDKTEIVYNVKQWIISSSCECSMPWIYNNVLRSAMYKKQKRNEYMAF